MKKLGTAKNATRERADCMPSQTAQGIVLRTANYRDHDRMMTLLSPEHGRIEVLSRGCRRPKSPLMPASEVFVRGEFVLFHNSDRYTLTSCTIADPYYSLRLDHYRLTCASYLLGLALAAAQPGEDAKELYDLLLQGLQQLAHGDGEAPLDVVTTFLLVYAELIGYKPRMNHCAHCRAVLDTGSGALLDVQAGGLVCDPCGGSAYRLTGAQVAWMRRVMREGLAEATQKNTGASDLFIILRRYVESRLETSIKVSRLLP